MKKEKEKIENWEKEFDKKWYLWDYSERFGTYNTCGSEVKFFIRTLLQKEREKLFKGISKGSICSNEIDKYK